MKNPSKFIKSYVKKFKKFKLTPLELEKFTELVRILSNADSYGLQASKINEDVAQKRLKICQACEYVSVNSKKYGSTDPHCNLCGCNVIQKVKKTYDQCPMNKWMPDDSTYVSHIDQAVNYINDQIEDENWITLLSAEEQFETTYQEAIQKLEKDSSTDLVDELIAQSESEEEIENE